MELKSSFPPRDTDPHTFLDPLGAGTFVFSACADAADLSAFEAGSLCEGAEAAQRGHV